GRDCALPGFDNGTLPLSRVRLDNSLAITDPVGPHTHAIGRGANQPSLGGSMLELRERSRGAAVAPERHWADEAAGVEPCRGGEAAE
ncbi:MAG TPA: hypothetical protein VH442_21170, partial [Micromonosporaceae bacterium]